MSFYRTNWCSEKSLPPRHPMPSAQDAVYLGKGGEGELDRDARSVAWPRISTRLLCIHPESSRVHLL